VLGLPGCENLGGLLPLVVRDFIVPQGMAGITVLMSKENDAGEYR